VFQQAFVTLGLFCLHYRLPFPSVTVSVLLAFLDFLHSLMVPTIKNNISSVKARFQLAGIDLSPFFFLPFSGSSFPGKECSSSGS
jgi:hypothetical protein